jgi:hypothetical protein
MLLNLVRVMVSFILMFPLMMKLKQCSTCNSQGEFLEDKNWDYLWNVAQFKIETKK